MAVPSPRRRERDLSPVAQFARDVREGLGGRPKRLPPVYFYDALGSCLFDAICRLPWYTIPRAERGLLERHAEAILSSFGDGLTLADLGCGSGEKTAILAGALPGRVRQVHLVDVSAQALAAASGTLAALPDVSIVPHHGPYQSGLAGVAAARGSRGSLLALFLGSNVGNFDRPEAIAFLAAIRGALRPGDGLLLGADLVKPEAELRLAYDDPLGVTAAFNKNLLVRMNRELGADFDPAAFVHLARWNVEHSRVEMHLVSPRAQRVAIPGARCTAEFAAGETLWTESSYKYRPADLEAMGREAGLEAEAQWTDAVARFSLTRFRRAGE